MINYEVYKYDDKISLIEDLEELGFEVDELNIGMLYHTESGEFLDYYYLGNIITNYPMVGEEWLPIYSTEVYINSVRKGNIKLPSNKKVQGNERKYFNNFINRFLGEEKIK